MDLGFRGEIVDLYHRYRRGYPPPVIDSLVSALDLSTRDLVVDLGCGTGQLTLPLAQRTRAAIGIDPEPDMLTRARRTAAERGISNVTWILGSSADVPTLTQTLGPATLGAATIAQALHWMDDAQLFRDLVPLLRPAGGIAVITNGTPLWLHNTPWSRALHDCLHDWLGTRPTHPCGSDPASQQRYRAALAAAGLTVHNTAIDYADDLTPDQVVGAVYSALPVDRLPPPDQRSLLSTQIRRALEPHLPVREEVHVAILVGRRTR